MLSTHTALSLSPPLLPELEGLGWDLGICVYAKLRARREQAGASAVKDSEPSVVAVRFPALMAFAKRLLCARPCARRWNLLKGPDWALLQERDLEGLWLVAPGAAVWLVLQTTRLWAAPMRDTGSRV